MDIALQIGVFLLPQNASASAAADNVAALIAVRALLEHASGGDLLSAFLASQTAQVREREREKCNDMFLRAIVSSCSRGDCVLRTRR